MSDLLKSIENVGKAADSLTRACARHGALIDSAYHENPLTGALRRSYGAALLAPGPMLSLLDQIK